jgi:hypothetical protein
VIRRIINLSAAFLATTLLLGLTASMASADVTGLSISQVGYNAVGADSVWNRNAEYVDITAGAAAVNVKNLVVSDSWAKAKGDDNDHNCNTFTINSLPGVPAGPAGEVVLPAGHTARVYVGAGTPKVFGNGGRFHAVYMNSRCGYHGHIFNNSGDTVWIEQSGASDSLPYNFETGYYIR